jgi:hypothetical protein
MNLVLPAGVPTWLWITGAGVLVVLAVLGCWLLAIAARHRRERRAQAERPHLAPAAGSDADAEKAAKDRRATRLVNVATAICIVLYLGLFSSSFEAISGFAREFLKRTGVLVPATPLTLDGVVVGALFLSLAFVARKKSPAKANMLIWGMTLFAAYCGFTYGESGSHGSLSAGLYYAVMSIVGMFMFHMVLDLVQGDGDYVKSKYPSMGWRWLTHWSTLPVMLCWINHPPRRDEEEEKRPTVREAIDHWRHVKTIRARAKAVQAAEQHSLRLAAARRKGELAAAQRAAEQAAAPVATPAPAPVPPVLAPVTLPQATPLPQPRNGRPHTVGYDASTGRPTLNLPVPSAAEPTDDQPTTAPKVPATADACATWMEQWVKLAADHPQFANGTRGIKADEAQRSAGCSDRQARFVRDAARSGLLRAKAVELGVPVPDGYRDQPKDWLTAVAS